VDTITSIKKKACGYENTTTLGWKQISHVIVTGCDCGAQSVHFVKLLYSITRYLVAAKTITLCPHFDTFWTPADLITAPN